jgi:O-antigen/teichoic acid export membrane protein
MLNIKEHFKLTAIYTFFAAFPAVLQLFVYPIIEGNDKLGSEDFGYLAVAEALLSFMSLFCLFGMAISIARYYYEYNDHKKNYQELVSTIFQGVIHRGLLLIGIIWIFSDFISSFFGEGPLKNFESYSTYLIIIAFNRAVIAIALSLYRTEKALLNFVIVSIVSGLGRSVFQVIGVLYFDMSFKGYLIGTAIGGSFASFIILFISFYKNGFKFSKKINQQLYEFSFLLFLTDILYWGILFFDRFMLLKNPDQLGIYDNAIKFAVGVQFISQGLAGSIQPELFRLFKKGFKENESKIKSLSNLFVVENILVVGVFAIPIMIFIEIFYETNLVLSASLILIILMRTIINSLYQVFLWPMLYMKATKTYLYLNIIVVLIIVALNMLLVPNYGYYGSIIAFITAGISQVLMFEFYGKRIVEINWNKTKILYFPLGIVLFSLFMEFLKNKYEINTYLTSGSIITIMFLGLFILYRNELKPHLSKYSGKF